MSRRLILTSSSKIIASCSRPEQTSANFRFGKGLVLADIFRKPQTCNGSVRASIHHIRGVILALIALGGGVAQDGGGSWTIV